MNILTRERISRSWIRALRGFSAPRARSRCARTNQPVCGVADSYEASLETKTGALCKSLSPQHTGHGFALHPIPRCTTAKAFFFDFDSTRFVKASVRVA